MNTATATIEVKYADPPRDGKKQGTVKTADGAIYGVWPDKLGLLRPGNVYEVEVTERKYNGRVYRTIVKAKPQAANSNTNAHKPAQSNTNLDAEGEFVARVLSASIQACAVDYNRESLTTTARMLRQVYRDGMK